MKNKREFDIIVYGASGFTGRLIAEYLAERHGQTGDLCWALAGRNADKIAQTVSEASLPTDLPILSVDSADAAALRTMVGRTAVVLTAVGPYQLYGSGLLEACVEAGTDYVDLCGETNWMREMIIRHEAAAQRSGARIVFSCGFDSIPFDLGVYYLQQLALEKTGAPLSEVKGRVRGMKGHASGGTVASMNATMAAAANDPATLEQLKNPFCLVPDFTGPLQPDSHKPCYDDDAGSWAAPFVMATINMPNVHRSNALLDHSYGENFAYSEMLLTGPGDKGETLANAMAKSGLSTGGEKLQPGDGPSPEEQKAGFYDLLFSGHADNGEEVRVSVSGDRDPGYGSTSRMIAEAALSLALDSIPTPGGIWTPAAAMGDVLIKRLADNAGLTFKPE